MLLILNVLSCGYLFNFLMLTLCRDGFFDACCGCIKREIIIEMDSWNTSENIDEIPDASRDMDGNGDQGHNVSRDIGGKSADSGPMIR